MTFESAPYSRLDGITVMVVEDHEDTRRTLARLKAESPPDIQLTGHPQQLFAGKIERIKAGETPHPLVNRAGWTAQIATSEASFEKRVEQGRRAAAPGK